MALARPGDRGLALGAWSASQATAAGLAVAFSGIVNDLGSSLALSGAFGEAVASPVDRLHARLRGRDLSPACDPCRHWAACPPARGWRPQRRAQASHARPRCRSKIWRITIMRGAITGYIDVAQIVLYAFWLFFAGLIFYLRQEDRREGYPLESEGRQGFRVATSSSSPRPRPSSSRDGRKVQVPRIQPDARPINALKTEPWPGAPLTPSAIRWSPHRTRQLRRAGGRDVQDLPGRRSHRAAAGRDQFRGARGRRDPDRLPRLRRGPGQGGRHQRSLGRSGRIRSCASTRSTVAAGGKRVPVPVDFADVNAGRRRVVVKSLLASQFALAPATKNPDKVTLLEEDKIGAFYGGGTVLLDARPHGAAAMKAVSLEKLLPSDSRRRAHPLARSAEVDEPCAARLSRRFRRGLFRCAGGLERLVRVRGRLRRCGARRADDARARRGGARDPRRPQPPLGAHDALCRDVEAAGPEGRHRAAGLHQCPVQGDRRGGGSGPRRRNRRRHSRAREGSEDSLLASVAERPPLHLLNPQPALRCVANAPYVAETLAAALQSLAGQASAGAAAPREAPHEASADGLAEPARAAA